MKIGMIHAAAAIAVAGCCMCPPCDGKDAAETPAAAQKAAPAKTNGVAVEVNGKKLTYAELDADIAQVLAF